MSEEVGLCEILKQRWEATTYPLSYIDAIQLVAPFEARRVAAEDRVKELEAALRETAYESHNVPSETVGNKIFNIAAKALKESASAASNEEESTI